MAELELLQFAREQHKSGLELDHYEANPLARIEELERRLADLERYALTGQGAGSGLDADTVDGVEGVHDHSEDGEGGATLGFTAITGTGASVPDGWTLGLAGGGRAVFNNETIDDLSVKDAILDHTVLRYSFDLLSGTVLPTNQIFSIHFRRNTVGPGSSTHYFKIIEIDVNAAWSGVAVTGWYTAGDSHRYNSSSNAMVDLSVVTGADQTTGAQVRYSKLWNHNATYFKVLRDTQGDGHDKIAVYFVMSEWHRGEQAHFTITTSNPASTVTVWQEGNDMGAGVTPSGTEITAT